MVRRALVSRAASDSGVAGRTLDADAIPGPAGPAEGHQLPRTVQGGIVVLVQHGQQCIDEVDPFAGVPLGGQRAQRGVTQVPGEDLRLLCCIDRAKVGNPAGDRGEAGLQAVGEQAFVQAVVQFRHGPPPSSA